MYWERRKQRQKLPLLNIGNLLHLAALGDLEVGESCSCYGSLTCHRFLFKRNVTAEIPLLAMSISYADDTSHQSKILLAFPLFPSFPSHQHTSKTVCFYDREICKGSNDRLFIPWGKPLSQELSGTTESHALQGPGILGKKKQTTSSWIHSILHKFCVCLRGGRERERLSFFSVEFLTPSNPILSGSPVYCRI